MKQLVLIRPENVCFFIDFKQTLIWLAQIFYKSAVCDSLSWIQTFDAFLKHFELLVCENSFSPFCN